MLDEMDLDREPSAAAPSVSHPTISDLPNTERSRKKQVSWAAGAAGIDVVETTADSGSDEPSTSMRDILLPVVNKSYSTTRNPHVIRRIKLLALQTRNEEFASFATGFQGKGTPYDAPTLPVQWIVLGHIAYCAFHQNGTFMVPKKVHPVRLPPAQKCRLQWAHPRYIYLAYIPMWPRFDGLLFKRLQIDDSLDDSARPYALQVTNKVTTKWFNIKEDVRQSWSRLELMLEHSCRLLLPHTAYRDIDFPRRPSSYGPSAHDVESKMREMVTVVRDAFLPLMGLLSFLIASLEEVFEFKVVDGPSVMLPEWAGILSVQHKMHMAWVNSLLDSDICNWSLRRVGMVVDLQECPFLPLLFDMIPRRVRIVYKWDLSNPNYLVDEPLSPFVIRTVGEERAREILLDFKPPLDFQQPCPSFTAPPAPPSHRTDDAPFEWIEQHDDGEYAQASGYGWDAETAFSTPAAELDRSNSVSIQALITREEFFTKRYEENEKRRQLETPTQLERREELARSARIARYPGKNTKARVFYWKMQKDGLGCRKELSRGQFVQLLSGGSFVIDEGEWWEREDDDDDTEQIETHFDAFRNEWDLWHGTKSSTTIHGGAISDDEYPQLGEASAFTNVQDASAADLREVLHVQATTVQHAASALTMAQGESFLGQLTRHYGLRTRGGTLPYKMPSAVHNKASWGIARAKSVVLLSLVTYNPVGIQYILDFLSCILNKVPPPRQLWDMAGLGVHEFGNKRVFASLSNYCTAFPRDPQSLSVKLYEITMSARTPPCEWRLFVPRASTALEIMRLDDIQLTSLSTIASFLASHGMPFVMGREVPSRQPLMAAEREQKSLLGVRYESYIPDDIDYAEYIDRRDQLLRCYRARKLLQLGGIHARIARQYYEDHGMTIEFNGPSELDDQYECQELVNVRTGMVDLIDDGLSIEELDLVSGVYILFKGNHPKAGRVSWWPPHWNWDGCGRDVGRWTSDCEDWYERRRAELESLTTPTESPLIKQKDWRTALRFLKETKTFRDSYESFCADFLQGRHYM